ncbi:hypothetical protein TNCV_3322331 [Trichonephila clavipes]|nr:hypothetical protein TNCV_3322331 [Trichonephila clavipes]
MLCRLAGTTALDIILFNSEMKKVNNHGSIPITIDLRNQIVNVDTSFEATSASTYRKILYEGYFFAPKFSMEVLDRKIRQHNISSKDMLKSVVDSMTEQLQEAPERRGIQPAIK